MNQFVLKNSIQSNFGQSQLQEYQQQQPKAQYQALGIDVPTNIQDIQTFNDALNIESIPSKNQNVNIEYKNLIPNNKYNIQSGGVIPTADYQGVLKETRRKNPSQVKEFIPEDYLYGDGQHTAVKVGKMQAVQEDYLKAVPQMIQAQVNDTVKQKPVDMARAAGEFNPNYEFERQLINHDLKQTHDYAQYNQNEQYGNAYYKRISTEAHNRTDQAAAKNGLMVDQKQALTNYKKDQNIKYVPNNVEKQIRERNSKQYITTIAYDINKFDPKQNPCLRQFLNDYQYYQNKQGRQHQSYQGHIVGQESFGIISNNRILPFARQYDPKLQGRLVGQQSFGISTNNRTLPFARKYGTNFQSRGFTTGVGQKMALPFNKESINLGQYTDQYNPFDYQFTDGLVALRGSDPLLEVISLP